MGAGGMRTVAEVSAQRAHHLANLLASVDGLSLAHPSTPFLWEFVLRTPGSSADFARALRERGIVAGLPLGRIDPARDNELLVCCTELTRRTAIDRYAAAAADVINARTSRARRDGARMIVTMPAVNTRGGLGRRRAAGLRAEHRLHERPRGDGGGRAGEHAGHRRFRQRCCAPRRRRCRTCRSLCWRDISDVSRGATTTCTKGCTRSARAR